MAHTLTRILRKTPIGILIHQAFKRRRNRRRALFAIVGLAALIDLIMPQPQPICLSLIFIAALARECARTMAEIIHKAT